MDWHSRLVTYFKVLLPLIALYLLASLFLAWFKIRPPIAIPFNQKEIEDRLQRRQVTDPYYSGVTSRGDEITVTAARTLPGKNGNPTEAVDLASSVDLVGGGRVVLTSKRGLLFPNREVAVFIHDVVITSSDGIVVDTQELSAQLNGFSAETSGRVHATGPLGELTAGSMYVEAKPEGGPPYFFFRNDVKVRYLP